MTIDVTVTRGLGDRIGEDVRDPLLTDTQAAISRGNAELDAATPASIVEAVCGYRGDIEIGDRSESTVGPADSPYRAQVIGIDIAFSAPADLSMRLRLWRPLT